MKSFWTYIFFSIALVGLLSACGEISGTAPDVVPSETGAAEVQADTVLTSVDIPPGDLQDTITTDIARAESAQIPIITETHQGSTYGPDQQVIVFVEGFQPGEVLSVSAMHERDGIVKSATTETNMRGEAVIYHYVQHNPSEKGAYPYGEITFRVRSSTGLIQNYTFNIDYTDISQPAQIGCGTYPPSPIHLGSAFVAWCSGFDKNDYLETNYQTEYTISNAGTILLLDSADVMADGLAFVSLSTESSDPAGDWNITIGGQSFQVQVVSP